MGYGNRILVPLNPSPSLCPRSIGTRHCPALSLGFHEKLDSPLLNNELRRNDMDQKVLSDAGKHCFAMTS